MAARRPARKSSFGNVRQLPSGRWQARYKGTDGKTYTARTQDDRPLTFDTIGDAEMYLSKVRADISREKWEPPGKPKPVAMTLRPYADAWLGTRRLKVRTREEYRRILDRHILPVFGDLPMAEITPAEVRTWHAREMPVPGARTGATIRARSYTLLRAILATAVDEEVITRNPCRIRGASSAPTGRTVRPATVTELTALVAVLPERYRMLAQLAAWCSLRFGECAGLQRADIDLKAGVLHVRRGIVRTSAGLMVDTPKSSSSSRTVTIPEHLHADLKAHLKAHSGPGPTGWVFPAADGAGPLSSSSYTHHFGPAATAAGRPDLTPHGLRHTGQTWAAAAGATMRELMARAGQSSAKAALTYLHEVDGRQAEIAQRLADYATGTSNVTPIRSRKAE